MPVFLVVAFKSRVNFTLFYSKCQSIFCSSASPDSSVCFALLREVQRRFLLLGEQLRSLRQEAPAFLNPDVLESGGASSRGAAPPAPHRS